MAAAGLRIGLRSAIAEAKSKLRTVQHEHMSIRVGDALQRVMVTVQPMPKSREDKALFLVVFQDVGLPIHLDQADVQAASANHNETDLIIAQLERELETARSDLDNSLQPTKSKGPPTKNCYR